MKFSFSQETIILRGEPSLGKTLVSLKAMMRTLKHEGSGLLVELNQITAPTADESTVPLFLHGVLDKYDSVFNMPRGLPPV